jgi:hypothetical protein
MSFDFLKARKVPSTILACPLCAGSLAERRKNLAVRHD